MSQPGSVRFRDFELDLRGQRLLKSGADLRLAPQPFRLLALLVMKAGQLVTRDEIRSEIWGDRHLEFDSALNFAIRRIRDTLNDSDTGNRIIETVPRRGYRFVAPVESIEILPPSAAGLGQRRRLALASAALIAICAGAFAGASVLRSGRPVIGFAGVIGASHEATALTANLEEAFRSQREVRLVPSVAAGPQLEVRLDGDQAGARITAALRWAGESAPRWSAVIVATSAELERIPADLATEVAAAMLGDAPASPDSAGRLVTIERAPPPRNGAGS